MGSIFDISGWSQDIVYQGLTVLYQLQEELTMKMFIDLFGDAVKRNGEMTRSLRNKKFI